MQDREEGARLLLGAGRDRTPLFEPVPHPLDPLPVHIDPVRAVDGSLSAPGRDGRSGAQLPDRRSQRVRRVATIGYDPAGDGGQKLEEIEALWRLAGLPGGEGEAQGPTSRVRNGMGLGAEAALASAKRLAGVPPFTAPAAFWCARMMVPSMKTRPSSGQLAVLARSKRRSQTPSLDQRRTVWAAIHHGPSSAGMARHLAPFCRRQTRASKVRRRLESSRPVWGRTASIKGSIAFHWTSVKTAMALLRRCLDSECPAPREHANQPRSWPPQNPRASDRKADSRGSGLGQT